MYYKRISDLKPLGRPSGGTDWNNLIPVEIIERYATVETDSTGTFSYVTAKSSPSADPLDSSIILKNFMDRLRTKFRTSNVWYSRGDASLGYETKQFTVHTGSSGTDDPERIAHNNFLKSLWLEAAISKDANNRPTAERSNIRKIQSKRLNVYTFLNSLDELEVGNISSKYIKSEEKFNAGILNATFISTNVVNAGNISSPAMDLTTISANKLIATAIRSSVGIIDKLTGDYLYYKNTQIDSLDRSIVSAETGYFRNDVTTIDSGSASAHIGTLETVNFTSKNIIKSPKFKVDGASISEMFSLDKNYILGRLVQFTPTRIGSTNRYSEMSLATTEVHGIVSETPTTRCIRSGMLLNYKLISERDRNLAAKINWPGKTDSTDEEVILWLKRVYKFEIENVEPDMDDPETYASINYPIMRPIIMLGRTKVTVTPPVNRFEKIYLRKDIPGVACSKTGIQWWKTDGADYMNRHGVSTSQIGIYDKPIGVALQSYIAPNFGGGASHVYLPTSLSNRPDGADHCAVFAECIVQTNLQ